MICIEPESSTGVRQSRSALAADRARIARASLAACHLCEHHCGVNRFDGAAGRCHAGHLARVFSAQVEVADELDLIPTFAIALSACDLRCAFCITGRESWNPQAGEPLAPKLIAERAEAALESGARSVMLLGGEPTVFLADALEIVSLLPDSATLIWKTNAHGSAQARRLLDGMFDVWLADYKFGNDACASRLAGVANYNGVVRENLQWAFDWTELIVRHLVMPGHVDCCWRPIAAWIAKNLPGVKVNLRSGFWPAWQSRKHSELRTPVSKTEQQRAWEIAQTHQLNLIL